MCIVRFALLVLVACCCSVVVVDGQTNCPAEPVAANQYYAYEPTCNISTTAVQTYCSCVGAAYINGVCMAHALNTCSNANSCVLQYINDVNAAAEKPFTTQQRQDCPLLHSLHLTILALISGWNYAGSTTQQACQYQACSMINHTQTATSSCQPALSTICVNPGVTNAPIGTSTPLPPGFTTAAPSGTATVSPGSTGVATPSPPSGPTTPSPPTPVPVGQNYQFTVTFANAASFDEKRFIRQLAEYLKISDSDVPVEVSPLQTPSNTVTFYFFGPNAAAYAASFVTMTPYERSINFPSVTAWSYAPYDAPAVARSKTGLYVGIGVGVGALIIILVVGLLVRNHSAGKEEDEELLSMPYQQHLNHSESRV